MKMKRSLGVLALGVAFCLTLTGLTGCGKKEAPEPQTVDMPQTVAEANIQKLKEMLPGVDENSIAEAVKGIEALGFGTIQEDAIVTVTDGEGKVQIADENGKIMSLVVKGNAIVEALDADSQSAWLAVDLTADAAGFESATPTPEPTGTEEPATPTDADEQEVEDPTVSENEVKDQEYCSYEKQEDGSYVMVANGKLNDNTVLSGGRRVSAYVDVIDEALVAQKDKAVNRDLFYDLIATSLMNSNTLIKEFQSPNYSVVLAYISQVYSGCENVKLENTTLKVTGRYCEFTYEINNDGNKNVISMDSMGVVTWDGEEYKIKDDKLQNLKTALSTLESDVNGSDKPDNEDSQDNDADEDDQDDTTTSSSNIKPVGGANYDAVYALLSASTDKVIQNNIIRLSNELSNYGEATQLVGNSVIFNNDVTFYVTIKTVDANNGKTSIQLVKDGLVQVEFIAE